MATRDGRPDAVRERLRGLLEERQRRLRARIAACEELTAEMGALLAALRGPGDASPALLPSPPRRAQGPAGGARPASPSPASGESER